MTEEGRAAERYFYHNFPRRKRGTQGEIAMGCQVLSLVKDFGLVMAPEIVKWAYEHADGSPPRTTEVLQQRVCFTELEPRELPSHAEKFGHFALEFKVPALKSLGAIPVFYVPRAMSAATGAEGAASVLVMQLIDAMVLTMRIAGAYSIAEETARAGFADHVRLEFGFKETGNKEFFFNGARLLNVLNAFSSSITPPAMLQTGLENLLKFFYPADDVDRDKELVYFRQREWRIVGNVAVRDVELMRRPSDQLIERLKALDPEFFAREFPPKSAKSLAEGVFVLPGLGNRRILQMVNRIVVPEEAVSRVHSILKDLPDAPKVVPLELLSEKGPSRERHGAAPVGEAVVWGEFFDSPGIDLPPREQLPPMK
jgi:hypothetical protein